MAEKAVNEASSQAATADAAPNRQVPAHPGPPLGVHGEGRFAVQEIAEG
jgi:hypothetical protein